MLEADQLPNVVYALAGVAMLIALIITVLQVRAHRAMERLLEEVKHMPNSEAASALDLASHLNKARSAVRIVCGRASSRQYAGPIPELMRAAWRDRRVAIEVITGPELDNGTANPLWQLNREGVLSLWQLPYYPGSGHFRVTDSRYVTAEVEHGPDASSCGRLITDLMDSPQVAEALERIFASYKARARAAKMDPGVVETSAHV